MCDERTEEELHKLRLILTDKLYSDLRKDLFELERRLEDLQNNPRDQYHTMEELYLYRMLYNALAANALNEGSKIRATKSWRHHDGELCFGGGWFIVTIDLSTSTEQNKQITNHYKSEYWDLFQIPERPVADPWNGHTPAEGAEDLHAFLRRYV